MTIMPLPDDFGFPKTPRIPHCRDREIHFSGSDNKYSISEYTAHAGSFPCTDVSYAKALRSFVEMVNEYHTPGARFVLQTERDRIVFERTQTWDAYTLAVTRGKQRKLLAVDQPHNDIVHLVRHEFWRALKGAERFSCWMGGDNELR